MKKILMIPTILLGLILITSGSDFLKGWTVEYGKAHAHLEEVSLAKKGGKFIGKNVLVRGVAEKVDTSKKGDAKVFLSHGTECHFGNMVVMAKSIKVGDRIVIAGFLEKGKDGKLLLNPASKQDPKAPFNP